MKLVTEVVCSGHDCNFNSTKMSLTDPARFVNVSVFNYVFMRIKKKIQNDSFRNLLLFYAFSWIYCIHT